jgi:pimeloyl-ACP methyl ester carboxylesterase
MEALKPVIQIANVSGGQIEYCLSGNGPTVLISHGTLGGFDQGFSISRLFIGVPIYVSHAVNDPLAPFEEAKRFASCFPQAHFHEIADGGHIFFAVHKESVIPKIEQFLLENAPMRE